MVGTMTAEKKPMRKHTKVMIGIVSFVAFLMFYWAFIIPQQLMHKDPRLLLEYMNRVQGILSVLGVSGGVPFVASITREFLEGHIKIPFLPIPIIPPEEKVQQ